MLSSNLRPLLKMHAGKITALPELCLLGNKDNEQGPIAR